MVKPPDRPGVRHPQTSPRLWHRLALVPAFLLAASLLVPVAARTPEATAQEEPTGEIEELRTATSKTVRHGDGTFTTTLHADPIHFREGGRWRPISSALVSDPEPGFAYRNEANSFRTHFKGESAPGYLRLDTAAGEFALTLEGSSRRAAQARPRGLTYPEVFSGVRLRYDLLPQGLKESLVLENAGAPTSYRFLLTPPPGASVDPVELPDGSYEVWAGSGAEPAFVLGAPWAAETDASGEAHPDADPHASMSVAPDGTGRWVIDLAVDEEWLRAPERAFPVILDPTVTFPETTQHASFDAACSTCTGTVNQRLPIGTTSTQRWRAAIQFDLSGLPPGAAITQADLRLFHDGHCVAGRQDCGGTAHTLQVRRMAQAWTPSSTSGALQISPTLATYTLPNGASPQWMSWGVTDLVTNWLSGTWANHGLLVKRDTEPLSAFGPRPPSPTYAPEPGIRPHLRVSWSGDGVVLHKPTTLHSNGAELSWSRYQGPSGAPFTAYEVHRSRARGFTPSTATLLAVIADPAVTTFTDTTAAPDREFTYKVIGGEGPTNEQTVTLPPDRRAVTELQPGPAEGKASYIAHEPGNAAVACHNFGAGGRLRVGNSASQRWRSLLHFDLRQIPPGAEIVSAELSLYYPPQSSEAFTVRLHRGTRSWTEGKGQGTCNGSGVTWNAAHPGVSWPGGGAFDAATVEAAVNPGTRSQGGRDVFSIRPLVQRWVAGTVPNHGVLIKRANDDGFQAGWNFEYKSDDYATSSALRPRLSVEYRDGSHATAPTVSVASPADGSLVWQRPGGNPVTLRAAATDDGRVDQVEFLLDDAVIDVDSAAPFAVPWDPATTSQGPHTLKARGTDDAGNVSVSQAVAIAVDEPPSAAITAPSGQNPFSGVVTVSADAGDQLGVERVEFLVDGVRFAEDATAPYSVSWDTLDPALVAYDGAHVLMARAVDTAGQETSVELPVTVDNTTGTMYRALITPTDPEGVPAVMISGQDSPVDVDVTNQSAETWSGGSVGLAYRWIDPEGAVVAEGAPVSVGQTVQAGATKTVRLTVSPPPLPEGAESGAYTLRFDLHDASAATWFSLRGNPPLDNPVILAKSLSVTGTFGLERWFHYENEDLGAGMSHLTNVANGNSILRWTPMTSPGRGLSTVLSLTNNTMDGTRSPAGNGWSLSISSLMRLGSRLDIHPNKADTIAGRANRWIGLTDGDGTTHIFEGSSDGSWWAEPDGVHLYLRVHDPSPNSTRKWAITRPDRVTFFFDADGYPTYVRDRNGNEVTFVYENVPPGQDPGGAKKRVIEVKDPAGRSFTIDYYSKSETKGAHVRGRVQQITGHQGDYLRFDYYEDGNLLRLTQGGTGSDGEVLERSFVFTYTDAQGSGPAIADPAQRVDPNPRTPNQSTRPFSVRDPRGTETTFDYYGPGQDPQLRWRLESRTDRGGQRTDFAYDFAARTSTVSEPVTAAQGRSTSYDFDTRGRVTSILDAEGRRTQLAWNGENHVTRLTEPGGAYTTFAYNDNGYLTERSVLLDRKEAGEADDEFATTLLEYQNLAADANDVSGKWKQGRTTPHISQLVKKVDPNGVGPGGSPTGTHQWLFAYDDPAVGNLVRVTDPEGHPTNYTWNPNGTLARILDANGHPLEFLAYHDSGQPTLIRDAEMQSTRLEYRDDGLLTAAQDPLHAGDAGGATGEYRSEFFYDGLGRLVRQSTPKSTRFERGTLIWAGASYDLNDNLTKEFWPRYGDGFTGGGSTTAYEYDQMDRPTSVTDPEDHATRHDYDLAGRLTTITRPKGVATAPDNDYAALYAYDLLDRLVRETRHEFDKSGAATGRVMHTHRCYSVPGDVVSVTSPRADLATIDCALDRPFTTTYAYDDAHRLLRVTDPEGRPQSLVYDRNGEVVRRISPPPGGTETTDYDQRNLPVRITRELTASRSVTEAFAYDGVGNVTRHVSPRGWDAGGEASPHYVTEYEYDGVDRLLLTKLPIGPGDTTRHYVHQRYDPNGNLLETTLPTDKALLDNVAATDRTTMTYFDPGWIRTSHDGVNPKVHYDYEAAGWQRSRIPAATDDQDEDGLNQDLKGIWRYNPDGTLAERTDVDGEPITYGYDPHNNLVSFQDASGIDDQSETEVLGEFAYDSLDLLVESRHRKASEAAWRSSVYGYDRNANLSSREDEGRLHTFAYDPSDWLQTQTDEGPDKAAGTADDRRIENVFFDTGWEQTKRVFRGPGQGTLKQTTGWTWLRSGLLDTVEITAGGAVRERHDLSYEEVVGGQSLFVNGHRTEDQYLLDGPGTGDACFPSACTATWSYDARDRLLRHDAGTGAPGGVTEYELDPAGNIVTEIKGSTTRTFTYEGSQLTEERVDGTLLARYHYDPLARLWCVTTPAGSKADCDADEGSAPGSLLQSYTWDDSFDRLLAYREFSGGSLTDHTTYTLDALDRVVSQTENHEGTSNDRTTTFSYLGLTDLLLQEIQDKVSSTADTTKDYLYDVYGNRVAMTKTEGSSTSHYTYGYDPHGSVSLLIGDGGSPEASYGYDPYGKRDDALTEGDTSEVDPLNPYRYSGRRWDSGSESYDMGARRFGPDTSRFLSRDLYLGALEDLSLSLDPLTGNRYALAGGSPVSYAEWDGHMVMMNSTGNGSKNPGVVGGGSSSGGGASSGGGISPQALESGGGAASAPVSRKTWRKLTADISSRAGIQLSPTCYQTPGSLGVARSLYIACARGHLVGVNPDLFRRQTGAELFEPADPEETRALAFRLGIEGVLLFAPGDEIFRAARWIGGRILARGGARAASRAADEFVDLTTTARRNHILHGDRTGGGHLWPGLPGKAPFPRNWSADRVLHEISDVATDPAAWRNAIEQGNRTVLTGTRGGVNIRVVVDTRTGEIITGYPTSILRSPG